MITTKQPQDINRQVAEKVMGWKYYYKKSGYNDPEYQDENGAYKADVFEYHPSISIEQAFQVVDKMIADGYDIYISHDQLAPSGDDWEVVIYKTTISRHKSLPLAICKAALNHYKSIGDGITEHISPEEWTKNAKRTLEENKDAWKELGKE